MKLEGIKAVFESHPGVDIVYVVKGMPFIGDDRGKREAHNYAVKQCVEMETYKRDDVFKLDKPERVADDDESASNNGNAEKSKSKK